MSAERDEIEVVMDEDEVVGQSSPWPVRRRSGPPPPQRPVEPDIRRAGCANPTLGSERRASAVSRLRLIWRLWRMRKVSAEIAAGEAIMREGKR